MKAPLPVLSFSILLLTLCSGCFNAATPTSESNTQIVSDGAVSVANGQITEGRAVVSDDVEKEIYKSLNHRRKMIAAIQAKSGSSAGLQQMQDELNLLTKGFMSRYGLSESEIAEILSKGDSNNWE